MTVIIAKDRVLYSDSRVSKAGELISDEEVKFTIVKDAQWAKGEVVLI